LAEDGSGHRKVQQTPEKPAQSLTSAELTAFASPKSMAGAAAGASGVNNANTKIAIQRAHDPRATLSPTDVMALQRTIGNQAVQRLLVQRQPVASEPVNSTRRKREEREEQPASHITSNNSQFSLSQHTPITSQQGTQRIMRSMDNAPQRNLKLHAPKSHIQRAGNWDNFKDYTKGLWGKGGKFREEGQDTLDYINPRKNYQKHAEKGGRWNKAKGVLSAGGHLLTSPFAGLYGAGSFLGRGLQTVGAGAYYGARGIGSGIGSGAMSLGRGAMNLGRRAKAYYNRDRNPHNYDRDRVPNSMKTGVEIGKPGATLGLSGTTLGVGESMSTGAGFPGGAGMMNVLTTGDAMMTWRNGAKRRDEARGRGDNAGEILGNRKVNSGKMGVVGGTIGIGGNALNLATALKTGSQGLMSINDLTKGANYVSTGLGIAGAGLGIAGGALTTGQGLFKMGKAISKLHKLSKSAPMLTPDGDRWRAHIKDRQKTKVGLNTLKTIAGVLGIAAGALVIASNPVGWALGVAAAITLGGLMAGKLYTKWKKARRKQKAKAGVREEMQQEQQQNAPPNMGMDNENNGGGGPGHDEAGMHNADPSQLKEKQRKDGVELGNRIAQKVSKSGKIAGEIRASLNGREHPAFAKLMMVLKDKDFTPKELREDFVNGYFPPPVKKAHDALVMLSVLNLSPEVVEKESGQELIEKKLSATDSI
jgi:hypothetical protein